MTYSYKPEKICPSLITFDLEGDKVRNISFQGGCNGNLKIISRLLDGQSVDYVEKMLRGNTCGRNSTSCGDQLAIAVRMAYEKEKEQAQ